LLQTTDYYRQAIKLQGDSLELRRELAQALLCLGLTEHYLCLKPEAPQPLREAAALYRELAEQYPEDRDLAYGQIASEHLLGMAYYDFDQAAEAVPLLRSAYQRLAQLDFAEPPAAQGPLPVRPLITRMIGEPYVLQSDTVIYLSKLAQRGLAKGHEPEIRRWGRETRARLEEFGGPTPPARLSIALAALYLQAAGDAADSDLSAREQALTTAAKHLLSVPQESRNDVRHRFIEIQIVLGLADVYRRQGRGDDSLELTDEAVRRVAPMVERLPRIVEYEFIPPREIYAALRQMVSLSVQATAAEVATGDAQRTARQARRLKEVTPLLPQLMQHIPKEVAADAGFEKLVEDCAAALRMCALHREAAVLLQGVSGFGSEIQNR
jgi:tetratricopeptide (TPR) repeat protein